MTAISVFQREIKGCSKVLPILGLITEVRDTGESARVQDRGVATAHLNRRSCGE